MAVSKRTRVALPLTLTLLFLSGCGSTAENLETSEPVVTETVTATATPTQEPEPEPELISTEDGCLAHLPSITRMSNLLELATDDVNDGESTAYLAGDFRDIGQKAHALSTEVADSNFSDALIRWGDAVIDFAGDLATDNRSTDNTKKMLVATFELQSICAG